MKKCLIVFLLITSWHSYSAIILKIKGKKALIDLEGASIERGDRLKALNLYGRSLGLLQVKKVKKGKAIAVLIKGRMGVSWLLEPSEEGYESEPEPEPKKTSTEYSQEEYEPTSQPALSSSLKTSFSQKASHLFGIGLIAGSNYTYLNTSTNNSVAGFAMRGYLHIDANLIGVLNLRFLLGYQSLIATGKNCGLPSCNLQIHHPGGGILFRFLVLKHSVIRPWLGLGGFIFWPIINKSASLGLDDKSFASFHGSLSGAMGMDIHLSGVYIPIQISASMLNPITFSNSLKPGSKEFKPIYIGFTMGIALPF